MNWINAETRITLMMKYLKMSLITETSIYPTIYIIKYNIYNYSDVALSAADNTAEDGKRRKHAALNVRFRFEPKALETAVVFDKTTEVLLKEIGKRISEVSGDCKETYWLELRLGLAVQRSDAFSALAAVRDRHGV